jgi:hypothetical protein
MPAPVLEQTGSTWETTVLLSSTSPSCGQLSAANFWLVTTTPNGVIKPATTPALKAHTDSTGSFGSSCQVLVTFPSLSPPQVPATATLVIDQGGTSSTVMLAVSRNVTLNDYLVIPAITGASVTILSLLLSFLLVWLYDRKRKKPRSWGWLTRPILGSGAWTANDSWATNISTGLVVVGAILTVTSAANSLFPGVPLDRFAIVNIVAGFFVAAAPVVFGILYSWLTAVRPGLIADATARLPGLRAATICVPSGASITLAADTVIQDGSAHWVTVRGGASYQIPPGATIQVAAGVEAIARPCYEAAQRAVMDIRAKAVADASIELALTYNVDAAGAQAAVRADVQAVRRGAGRADDAAVQAGLQALGLAIEQAIAHLDIPDGKPLDRKKLMSAIEGNDVRAATEKVVRAAAGAPGSEVPPAIVQDHIENVIDAMRQAVPSIKDLLPVYNAMTCSGAADIGILPDSILQIDEWAGTLTIQASDVVDQPPSPAAPSKPPEPLAPDVKLVQLVPATPTGPSAAPLSQPAFIRAGGGAKVTVTGAADITLPKDTQIWTPQGRYYELRKTAALLVPQGTNLIVANLAIILIVNLLTMFGIGAELGIASVLADFSDASGHGHAWMFAGLIVVASLVIVYAATATRTMADPQPGSSISSQSGASFTL